MRFRISKNQDGTVRTIIVSGAMDEESGWDLLQVAQIMLAMERCRELGGPVRGDLTQLPGLLVARCLAGEALHARAWLIELWRLLRPALLGRAAVPPRIWST